MLNAKANMPINSNVSIIPETALFNNLLPANPNWFDLKISFTEKSSIIS